LGRVQLYAMTGVVGPVYASKRLFTRLDFQSDKGLESAKCGHSNVIGIGNLTCRQATEPAAIAYQVVKYKNHSVRPPDGAYAILSPAHIHKRFDIAWLRSTLAP
jgi:hypothetical protein